MTPRAHGLPARTRTAVSGASAPLLALSLALTTLNGFQSSPASAAINLSPPPLPITVSNPTGSVPRSPHSPGFAATGAGLWFVQNPVGYPAQRSSVLVNGSGTPLWADWDGDGLPTPGRYVNGAWYAARERVNVADPLPFTMYGGLPQDIPVTGDIDGDRKLDVGVFRDGTFRWKLGRGPLRQIPYGARGDQPLVGDWNGDGKSDVGVWRRGRFYLRFEPGAALPPKLPKGTVLSVGRPPNPVSAVKPGTKPPIAGARLLPASAWPKPLPRTFVARNGEIPPGSSPVTVGGPTEQTVRRIPDASMSPHRDSPTEPWMPPTAPQAGPAILAPTPPKPGPPKPTLPPKPPRKPPLSALRTVSLDLGTASTRPIVGDWDGDGSWTPGFISDGTHWRMMRGWAYRPWILGAEITVPAGSIAIPVPGTAGASPAHCLTASPASTARTARWASTVSRPIATPMPDGTELASDLARATGENTAYVVSRDLWTRLRDERNRTYIDLLARDRRATEWAIRRPASAALAATLAAEGGLLDNPVLGIGRATALTYADWLIRSVACQYGGTSPGGWGPGLWQSPLWAATAGLAAWYSWDRQPTPVREYVTAMVLGEAKAVLARGISFWKDRNGNFTADPGDTRAEDTSWDGQLLSLALAMFPSHPDASMWRRGVVERGIASFASPGDLSGQEVLNGVQLSSWLGGTNANDDGTVVNHSVLNPDYMAAVLQNLTAASTLRASGRPAPRALFHRAAETYKALQGLTFDPATGAAEPYGPVYQPDGIIYFPFRPSWGWGRRGIWVCLDASIQAWQLDQSAPNWMGLHAAGQRALQARFGEGRSYGGLPGDDPYLGGAEEYNASQLATAWWQIRLGSGPLASAQIDDTPA